MDMYARSPAVLSQARDLLMSTPATAYHVRIYDSNSVTSGSFNHKEFFNSSATDLGSIVLHSKKLSSTSDYLIENFASYPVGTVCVADEQTSGRGRGSNQWASPLGSLAFSFTRSNTLAATDIPLLQYISTLAVVKAIETIFAATACSSVANFVKLNIRIKWPNDIYHQSTKIGGVLCRAIYEEEAFKIVIGIGLNLDNQSPTICLNDVVQRVSKGARSDECVGGYSSADNRKITREGLIAKIFEHYEALERDLKSRGFSELKHEYIKYWMHDSMQLSVVDDQLGAPALVKIAGLTDAGLLLAVDQYGSVFELHPDGNSLDMMSGMIRKKI